MNNHATLAWKDARESWESVGSRVVTASLKCVYIVDEGDLEDDQERLKYSQAYGDNIYPTAKNLLSSKPCLRMIFRIP